MTDLDRILGELNRLRAEVRNIKTVTLRAAVDALELDSHDQVHALSGTDHTGSLANGQVPQSAVTQHQGALDHGSIGGLSDDDHPQYVLDSDWSTWSPTLAGGHVAGTGATITARYQVIAGMVEAEFEWVLGTGFTISNTGTITLPVEIQDNTLESEVSIIGRGYCRRGGSSTVEAHPVYVSATTFKIGTYKTDSTTPGYLRNVSVSDTLPVTFQAGDTIHVYLRYEAAT